MRDDDFEAARAALVQARREGLCTQLAAGWNPDSPAEAYRLQRAIADALGAPAGWKVSGLTPEQQAGMGVSSPLAAPLLRPWLQESGAALAWRGLVRPRLECEFAFEMQADLAPRSAPYTRAEVEAAISAMRLGVEIVDSRLPPGSSVWLELADNLNNGGYVVGAAIDGWQRLRYGEVAIELRQVGSPAILARGDGRAVLDGDPVGAVVLLANLAAMQPRGLRAGDLVTTGSCTGAIDAPGPGEYEAVFGALGAVRFRLDA